MADEYGKSKIEQLKDKVHSGLDLLSEEELNVLFKDAENLVQTTPQPAQATTPSVAPASVNTAPPAVETPKGQADLINLVPEKFRDKDEAASLAKMIKAMQEQEALLTQKSQEVSQLSNVVQELSRRPREEYNVPQQAQQRQPAAPAKEEPEVEIDDLGFLDSPVANAKIIAEAVAKKIAEEVARRVSVEQIRDYDTFTLRRTTFERFRADHPDFDTIRNEFSEACRLHPEWDNDINGLPKLYDLAKTLAKARNVAPAVTPAQPALAVDVEKLKAEIKAEVEAEAVNKAYSRLKEEILRRKAAAGIVSTSSTSTPQERVTHVEKTVPLTPADKTFQDMLDSGPKTLDKSLGPYGDILTLQAK